MRFRKPQLIPILFIIGASVLLFGLGIWQVERLAWKEGEIAHIKAAKQQDALGTLPADLSGIEYRSVVLTGQFLNDKMFRMVGHPQGEGPGFYIITPFRLEDDGRIVLVNRGFAPEGKENPVSGTQTISGIIRPNRLHRMFMPENLPEKNVWFYEDLNAMATIIGEPVLPLMIEATGEAKPGTYPTPSNGEITLRNDHLNYAITWFALGIIGLIMFAFYHKEPEKEQSS